MEWMIMDCNGLNGLCGSLGSIQDGEYVVTDDVHDTLTSLLQALQDDDLKQRQNLRQLATSSILHQDLVPMLIHLKDDPDVFHLAVKILATLTQPIECLVQELQEGEECGGSMDLPWMQEIGQMLAQAKFACADKKFIMAIFTEIRKIFEDAGEYDLVESDCESINQCLLLIRNILHIEGIQGQKRQFDFLQCLLECGLDEMLKELLNSSCRDSYGVTIVQMISLMYRDLVGEMFLFSDRNSRCEEEACDSANCSHCEYVMDRGCKRNKLGNELQASWKVILEQDLGFSNEAENLLTKNNSIYDSWGEMNNSDSSSSVLEEKFLSKCQIARSEQESQNKRLYTSVNEDSAAKYHCGRSAKSASDDTITGLEEEKSNSYEDKGYGTYSHESLDKTPSSKMSFSSGSCSSVDEISSQLGEFTFNFLQNCFSNLIQILKKTLLHQRSNSHNLDDSYFLWCVAFFLKCARHKNIKFSLIKDVLTEDVFGFVVFEGISNGKDVMATYRKNKPNSLSMRRLHLSVSALRELIKTLTYHLMRGVNNIDQAYLDTLQSDLGNMSDLRQMLLWLVRTFDPSCHSSLYLRDIIVTNHYFLLLLEDWLAKGYCRNNDLNMLTHVKQFAMPGIMQKYGMLLYNYGDNDHHVNNCAFTMMYHVAGDCEKTDALLQPDILQTFTKILDEEFPITTDMNDLMEYVIHKFLELVEEKPVSSAITLLLGESSTQSLSNDMPTDTYMDFESEWSEEEIDLVSEWFSELDGLPIMIDKIAARFKDKGIQKSSMEIINFLYKMTWVTDKQMESFLAAENLLPSQVPKLETSEQGTQKESSQEDDSSFMYILQELSTMEEKRVVPHCLEKLRAEGFGKQLAYLQECLLEAAFVKFEDDGSERKMKCEPVYKYCWIKGNDFPVMFYNEDQEKIRRSVYMLALMEQLGIHVDEEGILYPKIPAHLSVAELVHMAVSIGEVNKDLLKFDLQEAMTQVAKETKIDSYYPGLHEAKPKKVQAPALAWMKLVNNYNTQDSKGLKFDTVGAEKMEMV